MRAALRDLLRTTASSLLSFAPSERKRTARLHPDDIVFPAGAVAFSTEAARLKADVILAVPEALMPPTRYYNVKLNKINIMKSSYLQFVNIGFCSRDRIEISCKCPCLFSICHNRNIIFC